MRNCASFIGLVGIIGLLSLLYSCKADECETYPKTSFTLNKPAVLGDSDLVLTASEKGYDASLYFWTLPNGNKTTGYSVAFDTVNQSINGTYTLRIGEKDCEQSLSKYDLKATMPASACNPDSNKLNISGTAAVSLNYVEYNSPINALEAQSSNGFLRIYFSSAQLPQEGVYMIGTSIGINTVLITYSTTFGTWTFQSGKLYLYRNGDSLKAVVCNESVSYSSGSLTSTGTFAVYKP